MLKKINRGLGRKDFEISRKEGRLIQTPLFGVSMISTTSSAEATAVKVGFVISKKISKRAVDRNRIKRRLCEVIKKMSNDKLLMSNIKIIILVKKSILEAKMEEIEKCWDVVISKLNSKS